MTEAAGANGTAPLAGSAPTHCSRSCGQKRSTAIVHMTPQENAIMHSPPITMVRVALPPPDVWAGGAGVRAYEVLERRTAIAGLRVGACAGAVGVCVAGAAAAVPVAAVPAGGVILTPTFILKLLLPRYTTPSSPPSTCSATSTAFLSRSENRSVC
jgi:hypothetical protein